MPISHRLPVQTEETNRYTYIIRKNTVCPIHKGVMLEMMQKPIVSLSHFKRLRSKYKNMERTFTLNHNYSKDRNVSLFETCI
jgi:hypothetical protein